MNRSASPSHTSFRDTLSAMPANRMADVDRTPISISARGFFRARMHSKKLL